MGLSCVFNRLQFIAADLWLADGYSVLLVSIEYRGEYPIFLLLENYLPDESENRF